MGLDLKMSSAGPITVGSHYQTKLAKVWITGEVREKRKNKNEVHG
jgi:thioredoxin reductase